MVSYLD